MNRNNPPSSIQNFIHYPEKYLNKRSLFSYQRKFLAKVLPPTLSCDEFYMKFTYRKFFGKKLDLKNPSTFNEKIRWMNLFDRNPLYTKLADKYRVREYVKNKIGFEYLNPMINVFDDPSEVKWDEITDQCAIKMTHGSNWNIIIHDSSQIDKCESQKKLEVWSKKNFYHVHREWQYRNIKPKVLVEQYIPGDKEFGLLDYKFFCFDGKPTYIQVDVDRFSGHKRVMFDTDWNKLDFSIIYPQSNKLIPKPKRLKEMVFLAERLSSQIPFCRVDFYCIETKIIFGEITFTPEAGYAVFLPDRFDREFGDKFPALNVFENQK